MKMGRAGIEPATLWLRAIFFQYFFYDDIFIKESFFLYISIIRKKINKKINKKIKYKPLGAKLAWFVGNKKEIYL